MVINMFKIVKDTTKSIREKCQLVETPISQEIKDLALKMVEYLIKSQDDEYAEKHGIRSGVGLAEGVVEKVTERK